ncbi:hypothetical protein B7463_g7945, partial [Scytalidium lignicola]
MTVVAMRYVLEEEHHQPRRTNANYRHDDQQWIYYPQRVLRPHSEQNQLWPSQKKVQGVRSLQDCAIECILKNIKQVTPEGIACLPLEIVWRIWQRIRERHLICFREWSIFSKVLGGRSPTTLDLLRFRQEIKNPSLSLLTYTQPLISKQFDFITSLCIGTSCAVSDLVRLSEITNLSALHIIKPVGEETNDSCRIGDRLVRAWDEAASEGAFLVLRVLRLWGHEEITSKSLIYLNNFQSLAVYDVRGCGFDPASKVQASELGWRACVHKDILDVLEAACEEKLSLTQPSSAMEATPGLKFGRQQLYDTAKTQLTPRESMSALMACQKALVSDNLELWTDRRTWDFNTTTSLCRLGLLRNDLDLVQAGVPITTHALVEKEFVNSVPMASVCLGNTPEQYEHSSWSLMRLFFIRIKTIPPKPNCITAKDKSNCEDSRIVKGHHDKTNRKSETKERSGSISMRLKKRQKLDDMLSSFQ